jgi:drug/metabolite transporter (DMT)-like permease
MGKDPTRVFVTLALASAAFYGAGDFLGGIASKRLDAVVVTFIAQAAGLVLLALLLPLLPSSSPVPADYLWGVAAGVSGSGGVALLYRALAIGTMSIVAPITAVCAAAVPVLVALVLGERPGVYAGAGIVLAAAAIVLLSRVQSVEVTPRRMQSAVSLAFISGIAVGLFFLCLAQTSDDAGVWPLIVGRGVSVPLFAVMAVTRGRRLSRDGGIRRLERSAVRTAVGCGVVDMTANALYLIATRYGPLSLVATLASLYPASTVLLARFTLGERLSGSQALGVACALVAVVLIVSA